ncbi:MAG: GNAT family N-acetyltransferase [Thermoplasmata archaeon]|jgi:ribosomal protein S18 acetylase RimI-like enzyme
MAPTIPLSERPEEGWRLCRQAMTEIAAGRFPVDEWITRTRQDLDLAESVGVLAIDGAVTFGVALWNRTSLPARRVSLLYLLPDHRSPRGFREFLRDVIDASPRDGPVAFSTGDLLGLDRAEQAAIMEPLGFRQFARTEMEFPSGSLIPSISLEEDIRLRPVEPTDSRTLAGLHREAYADRFDRYLFMEDPDPGRDSARGMDKLLRGGWGPFLSEDSFVAERDGRLVGASLLVLMEGNPLLADAMVDSAFRGRRIGAALVTASLVSLRARSVPALRLNVTEGNARAQRLYRGLGFVPTFTDVGWYSPRCVPVPPEQE